MFNYSLYKLPLTYRIACVTLICDKLYFKKNS